LQDWLHHQQQVHPTAIDMGLTRVSRVAQALGLLPLGVPAVIVAGTNGKGSTSVHLSCLLQASGRRVGLYTSPHLRRYNERICIDGQPVTDAELLQSFEQIEQARGTTTLTYFEYNTLAALLLFRAHQVQVAVLEVGLGGRLDATNMVDAEVAVVCSIGLDHTEWLGATTELIGREKAGIFRAGRPVVLGAADMPDSVYAAAAALGCQTLVAQQDFSWQKAGGAQWRYVDASGASDLLPPPRLAGELQYRNAATAIAALRVLLRAAGWPAVDDAALARGIRMVRLEGRLQQVQRGASWLLDVAHNPAAAQVLAAELGAAARVTRTIAVFGMLADKDVVGVARALDEFVDHWCLCDLGEARGLAAAQLQQRMGTVRGSLELCGPVASACARASALATDSDRVVVCGSFHVVGPALDYLGL
jgi:dihydrofolate synthase/folylpolyglutamate synthase